MISEPLGKSLLENDRGIIKKIPLSAKRVSMKSEDYSAQAIKWPDPL